VNDELAILPRRVGVIGPGRMGRGIALTFALAGCSVSLVDVKARSPREAAATFTDARREMARDLELMVEEGLLGVADTDATVARIEEHRELSAIADCEFVQEALPEQVELKRNVFDRLGGLVADDAILASTSSTINPADLMDAVHGTERFLVAHWLNPAYVIPLVEVVPSPRTASNVVERTLSILERLGKTPVRCAASPGYIGPRLQCLLMNEAVRLVEEGVATPADVDRAFRAGMGFRYATIGIFEFIDWGGVDILHRASDYMTKALGDERFRAARLVEEKVAANELGPKTGRGFYDYGGERREEFETAKLRALLRQLKRERAGA
jgi:3-hydroxybutyryl-CoA dehydrogenase